MDSLAVSCFVQFVRLNPDIPADSPLMVKALAAYLKDARRRKRVA